MKSKNGRNSEKDDWDPVEESTSAYKVPKPKQPFLVNIRDIVVGNVGEKLMTTKSNNLSDQLQIKAYSTRSIYTNLATVTKARLGWRPGSTDCKQ
jgi:hypothetical protein